MDIYNWRICKETIGYKNQWVSCQIVLPPGKCGIKPTLNLYARNDLNFWILVDWSKVAYLLYKYFSSIKKPL